MSHFRFVQDWLEGWNSREPDGVMAHYAEDAVLQSPSVLAFGGSSDGIVRGRLPEARRLCGRAGVHGRGLRVRE